MISTFWAFAGMTSVHGIYMRMLHTFVLTDLLLVAMLLAVAITPLGLFTGGRRAAPAAAHPGRPHRRRRHAPDAPPPLHRARRRASVRQVERRHDPLGPQPHQQFARHAVALAVLLGPVRPM